MQAVGVRELKAKLSHYVRVARTGEVVLVTERGRVVAALGPPGALGASAELGPLQSLVVRGIALPGGPKRPGVYARTGLASEPGTAAAVVDALREEK